MQFRYNKDVDGAARGEISSCGYGWLLSGGSITNPRTKRLVDASKRV